MGSRRPAQLLLTCEHGGNLIPAAYRHLFRGQQRLLRSHRGLDIGAREAARQLRRQLNAPLICASVTRLLVDLNRSIGHPALFSEFTRALPVADRRAILARHYIPYRALVAGWIEAQLRRGATVVHVAVHSFTPILHAKRRRADVGLLYDPARSGEMAFCRKWAAALAARESAWQVRCNYPYRGTADGQSVELRRRFSGMRYFGIELELNQARLMASAGNAALIRDVAATLSPLLPGRTE